MSLGQRADPIWYPHFPERCFCCFHGLLHRFHEFGSWNGDDFSVESFKMYFQSEHLGAARFQSVPNRHLQWLFRFWRFSPLYKVKTGISPEFFSSSFWGVGEYPRLPNTLWGGICTPKTYLKHPKTPSEQVFGSLGVYLSTEIRWHIISLHFQTPWSEVSFWIPKTCRWQAPWHLMRYWKVHQVSLLLFLGCPWYLVNGVYWLGEWLNFKLFGITYLVGKIKFKLFFQGPLAKWV